MQKTLATEEATFLLADYLVLSDNQYILKLSKKEALDLGISSESYDKALDDIYLVNEEIQKRIADGEENFVLTDPTKVERKKRRDYYVPVRTKSSEELGGTITTSGQEVGYDGGWAPIGPSKVTFNCISFGAILPLYNVTTKTLGATQTGGGVGVIGSNTIFDVGIYATNTSLTVSFRTSDSNGGRCVWVLN